MIGEQEPKTAGDMVEYINGIHTKADVPDDLVAELATFVPVETIRRVEGEVLANSGAARYEGFAAVLFADVVGFSAQAERLLERSGADSTEELAATLNTQFTRWIEGVVELGGEVVKFAGDAVLAAFWAEDEAELREATLRAAACAQRIQHHAGAGASLLQRVRIGAGVAVALRLGGVDGRWELALCGPVMGQISRPDPVVEPGQSALSSEAWAVARGQLSGREVPGGALLGSVGVAPATRSPYPPDSPAFLRACVAYVPQVVRNVLGLGAAAFLAEHRPVTVMFIRLVNLQAGSEEDFARAQAAVEAVQVHLRDQLGVLDKVSIDDKGTSLLAAFGLPPSPSEGRALSAVVAALRLVGTLAGLGIQATVGVGSGRVFCGPVGSPTRREYTIIGVGVNLAARLMGSEHGGVVCDDATRAGAVDGVGWKSLGTTTPKGFVRPIPIWRPMPLAATGTTAFRPLALGIYGRAQEVASILARVRELPADGRAALTVVGPPGVGKTTLLREVARRAADEGVDTVQVAGASSLRSVPLGAWRGTFRDWLGVLGEDTNADQGSILTRVAGRPEWQRMVPLLAPVLHMQLADTEHTKALDGAARAAATTDLMLDLLVDTMGGRRHLLVLDDVQWFDPDSVQFAVEVARRAPGLLTVSSLRGTTAEFRSTLGDLLALADTVEVGGLDAQGVRLLVEAAAAPATPPISVARWLWNRTGGHPLFCRELVAAMLAEGVIGPGANDAATDAKTLDALSLPDSVEGAILSRLDRLSGPQQLIVKTASAAGRVWDGALLRAALPIRRTEEELQGDIDALVASGLVRPATGSVHGTWVFAHGLTLDVAYRTMVGDQRRSIHRGIANHLTQAQAQAPRPDHTLMGHHWRRAGEPARALDAMEASVRQALADGLLRAVTEQSRVALDYSREIGSEGDSLMPPERRARLLCDRGFALNDLALYKEAEDDVIEAAGLLGSPPPKTGLGWVVLLLSQAARQSLHRLLPTLFVRSWTAPDPRLRLLVTALNTMISTVYWTKASPIVFPAIALWVVNLTDRSGGPSPRGAMASLGFLLAAMRMKAGSRHYFDRGRRDAEATGNVGDLSGHLVVEGVCAALYADWERSEEIGREAVELGRQVGVATRTTMALSTAAVNAEFAGKLQEADRLHSEAQALCAEDAREKDEFNSVVRRIPMLYALGRDAEALDCTKRLDRLGQANLPLLDRYLLAGLRTWLLRREGRLADAVVAAHEGLEILGPGPRAEPGNHAPFLQIIDVLTDAVAASPNPALSPELGVLRTALKDASGIGAAFPVAMPGVLRAKARLQVVLGDRKGAIRLLRKAAGQAVALRMPLEEAHTAGPLLDLGAASGSAADDLARAALAVYEERGLVVAAAAMRERLSGLAGVTIAA